jgi:hypothetical protein
MPRAFRHARTLRPIERCDRLGGVIHEYNRACAARKLGQPRQVALRAPRWPLGGIPNRLATASGLKPAWSRGYLAGSCSSRPSMLWPGCWSPSSWSVLRRRPSATELLALRHEVVVLRRQVKRPDLLPADRLVLAPLGRRLPVGRLLFTPATVLRWHRELVRRRWSAFGRRPRRGRPPIPEEVRSLIVRMARKPALGRAPDSG